ncbi:multidrug effflux MFS transporter [Acidocella aminolytica]|jgi:DHA1 family bicyclomycin/chloramphenicol resistance-like MFS transporter|uniref:Drug resistance transporter Bcr/CflA n=1 Tax=Acidocella aminolytica 101 = DSM 11237 TaxID=1120923 RepID=A0A0D6PL64_9PROT|nr:multidrug effflux MFS transporter [Acidocella aminolytica]GAN81509.1 drug resistance transporter Bcr/CflA [Acidocella aminolytica 101 = DSM 11237]GBQ34023.1 major facilitator superfamily transporter [Acidocella aminolytica 101 = DSM 11237]SHF02565.1 MFS transporter, DHA1 family, bicyclomycin/chloramphenicol resistance protein [Acidocella aminolytica 101 = DSM 11237]
MQGASPHPGLSFRAFVATVAVIQTIVALAIDMMVPALGDIAAALHLGDGNARQWVIASFVISFGVSQLLYGLVADRFGRKPLLVLCLLLYVLGSFSAALASGFPALLTARALQGFGAAGAQVLVTAVIRDCYAGRLMAKVNSLSFMVFLSAPIIAPWLGQELLSIAPWQAIFIALGGYACLTALWVLWRLPETMHPQDRRPLVWQAFSVAAGQTLRNRTALGYTLAAMLLLGAWLGFINSAQQVFAEVFDAPKLFPLVFAICSVSMAIAALTNARLVERFGMRRLSHAALVGFILVSCGQAFSTFTGQGTLLHFAVLQTAMMFSFGLLAGNFSAISMEPLGHIAGTAAAVQGFIIMFGSALIGIFIGLRFNGTLHPLTLGFCVSGGLGLVVVTLAERGRLFHPHGAGY